MFPLRSEHWAGRFEKIAQSMISLSKPSPIKTGLSSAINGDLRDRSSRKLNNTDTLDLDNTLSKARDKADLQPLHRNTNIRDIPRDQPTAIKFNKKQKYLGDIEDKRITRHHLRGE